MVVTQNRFQGPDNLKIQKEFTTGYSPNFSGFNKTPRLSLLVLSLSKKIQPQYVVVQIFPSQGPIVNLFGQ